MNAIAFPCPLSSFTTTEGKILTIAKLCQRDGFAVTVWCWDDQVETACKQLALPFVRFMLERLELNRTKASQGFAALLGDKRIVDYPNAPTWADLLAFDDFYGIASNVKVDGTEGLRPDAILMPLPGGESSTENDEHLRVIIHRYATQNAIPIVGIEVERLDHVFKILRFPVDFTLRRDASREEMTFPLLPLYRYFTGHGKDPHVEATCMQEPELRKKMLWEPGQYYITIPLHLYYLQEHIQLLQELRPLWPELEQNGMRLVFICGNAYRRGLREKDMIDKGLAPWLSGIPYQIVENGNLLSLALMSEAVLFSHKNVTQELLEKWGIRCFQRGELKGLTNLTLCLRPQEALHYVVQNKGVQPCLTPQEATL
jgi:hypothetical protein